MKRRKPKRSSKAANLPKIPSKAETSASPSEISFDSEMVARFPDIPSDSEKVASSPSVSCDAANVLVLPSRLPGQAAGLILVTSSLLPLRSYRPNPARGWKRASVT